MYQERPIKKLALNESILDYITLDQQKTLFKFYENPLDLIDYIDGKLHKRKRANYINYPFRYIITIATEKNWKIKQ